MQNNKNQMILKFEAPPIQSSPREYQFNSKKKNSPFKYRSSSRKKSGYSNFYFSDNDADFVLVGDESSANQNLNNDLGS